MIPGHHPEPRVAVGEARRLRDDAHVGQQRHHEAGADGDAVDRGDYGPVEVDQVVDEVGGLAHRPRRGLRVAGHLLDQLQIAAGREGLPGARDQHHPRLGIGVDGQPHLGQLPVQARVGGVHRLGAIDRDEHDAVRLLLEEEMPVVGVGHGQSFTGVNAGV